MEISVIMPIYNTGRYVAETIESILKQTFTDFEFIIINDGSIDSSLEILQHYAQLDSRIRLISRENRGYAKTLNEGLSLANAPLIATIDSDDVAFVDRLFLQVQFMEKHPEVVCVGGYFEIIDEAGRVITLLKVPLDNEQIQDSALKGHCPIPHSAAMYRKSNVDQSGGYNEEIKMAGDFELWLRLGETGLLANIPHPVVKYRMLSNSISGQNPICQKQEFFNACQKAWNRRNVEYNFEFTDWRPDSTKKSRFDFNLKLGWWAFNYQQRKTALIYGLKAVILMPFNSEGWRLLICALIKPLPARCYG